MKDMFHSNTLSVMRLASTCRTQLNTLEQAGATNIDQDSRDLFSNFNTTAGRGVINFRQEVISARYLIKPLWNLVLLSMPNSRSHQRVSWKTNQFSQIQLFFEVWAIVFNHEIPPAERAWPF